MRIKYLGKVGFRTGVYRFSKQGEILEIDDKYAEHLLTVYPNKFELISDPTSQKPEEPKPTTESAPQKPEEPKPTTIKKVVKRSPKSK